MLSLKKKYLDRLLDYKFIYCLVTVLLLALPTVARAQTVIDILDGNTDVNQQEESEDIFNFSGDLLILEPVIQGYNLDDYAYVSQVEGREYISLSQMAQYLGLKYVKNPNNSLKIWLADNDEVIYFVDFVNRKVTVVDANGKQIEEGFWFRDYDLEIIDQSIFFSSGFWSKLLEADVVVDTLNMQLKIDREKDFPTIAKLKTDKVYLLGFDGRFFA